MYNVEEMRRERVRNTDLIDFGASLEQGQVAEGFSGGLLHGRSGIGKKRRAQQSDALAPCRHIPVGRIAQHAQQPCAAHRLCPAHRNSRLMLQAACKQMHKAESSNAALVTENEMPCQERHKEKRSCVLKDEALNYHSARKPSHKQARQAIHLTIN